MKDMITLRPAVTSDAAKLVEIYAPYILQTAVNLNPWAQVPMCLTETDLMPMTPITDELQRFRL